MSRKCPKKCHLFLNWLRANRTRFPFQPKVLRFRKKMIIEFTFIGVPREICFSFNSRNGISIAVMHKGECWDLIGDFDVAEEYSKEGWFCSLDLPEKRTYWATRKQMWTEHCFETFLAWCQSVLAKSRYLVLYKYSGCTWAKLLKDEKDRDKKDRISLIRLMPNQGMDSGDHI